MRTGCQEKFSSAGLGMRGSCRAFGELESFGGVCAACPDELQQRDVVQHLVSIVPGVERPGARVVVQHGDVRVLVVEGDVGVLVRVRGRVEGEVHFGSGQV